MGAPRFAAGDVLFVQEKFRVRRSGCAPEDAACPADAAFACDFPYSDPAFLMIDWRHALEMGPHLSRTTLLVERVQIRRVQDITDTEALAEGVVEEHRTLDGPPIALVPGSDIEAGSPRKAFALLWDQLNGAGAWARNPWVYALTVRAIHANVNVLLHGGSPEPP